MHDTADTTLPEDERRRAQRLATWHTVKLGNKEALDWAGRYDIATDRLQQDETKLNLSLMGLEDDGLKKRRLNMTDRIFLSRCLHRPTDPLPVSLDLSGHRFTDEQALWLASLLDESHAGIPEARCPLRSLVISYCRLTEQQMTTIAAGLQLSSLERLRYARDTGSASQDKQLMALAQGVKSLRTLRILQLQEHSSKRGLGRICAALKHSDCLEELDLSYCTGTTSDVKALGKLLKTTRTLATLNIGWMTFKLPTTFNEKAGRQWAAPTGKRQRMKRKAVTTVNRLRKKQLPINSAFEALAGNCSLTTLIVDESPFDDRKILALAAFIGDEQCRLQDLHYSKFADELELRTLEVLTSAAEKNRSLLRACRTSTEAPGPFDEALAALAARNLLHQALPAMQWLADRALNMEGAFPQEIAGAILDQLDPDSRVNLVRAAWP